MLFGVFCLKSTKMSLCMFFLESFLTFFRSPRNNKKKLNFMFFFWGKFRFLSKNTKTDFSAIRDSQFLLKIPNNNSSAVRLLAIEKSYTTINRSRYFLIYLNNVCFISLNKVSLIITKIPC